MPDIDDKILDELLEFADGLANAAQMVITTHFRRDLAIDHKASDMPRGQPVTEADRATVTRRTSVYVYEAPVRLWHWINAAAIMTLMLK